ncbi:MAG: hypothetical protein IKH94_08115, partial [Eubacterium sp.]|nr:hypothetical protein [Eubacterium sp.]
MVEQSGEQLLSVLSQNDERLLLGKTAKDVVRPVTSIAYSNLFTGATQEPQMLTELKKEIVSADRIDMLVSFIKWSGLVKLLDELRDFISNLKLTNEEKEISNLLIKEIISRLNFLINVGLNYLTLSRSAT